MSDLFHDDVPDEFVTKVWSTMESTPQHTYQILTKRPDRMAEVTAKLKILPNVWLGTSVESAEYLSRVDDLRRVRAAIRFISFEPLLGSVRDANLSNIHWAIVGGESGHGARPLAPERGHPHDEPALFHGRVARILAGEERRHRLDNGAGKRDPGTSPIKGGLGTSLVKALAHQLDAKVKTVSSADGMTISISHATFTARTRMAS